MSNSMISKVRALCMVGVMGLSACKTAGTAESSAEIEPTVATAESKEVAFKVEIIEAPSDVYDNAALMTPIYFSFDGVDLDDADKGMLDGLAGWMREHPNTAFVIEGHSDLEGPREYNADLGLERAERVHAYLTSLGISESRLKVATRGETQPAVESSNGVRHWRNRRVEFEVSEMPSAGDM